MGSIISGPLYYTTSIDLLEKKSEKSQLYNIRLLLNVLQFVRILKSENQSLAFLVSESSFCAKMIE